jgi:NnrS protein
MARENLILLRVLPNRTVAGRASVEIYRPFFLAGILTVLTAGCALGAFALLGISRAGTYTASAWTPHILAHANSQLFGWVGFFVIGFALQEHPPAEAKVRLFHLLASISLIALTAGIVLRFIAEPLVLTHRVLGVSVGLAACYCQILGVLVFLINQRVTRFKGVRGWQSYFVTGSLGLFLIIALAEPFIFLGSHQAEAIANTQFIAEWFPPLRDAQFLGFVTMMIFGVSLTKFHTCFGMPEANRSCGLLGLLWWVVGLVLHVTGHIWAYRHSFAGASSTAHFVGSLCLAVGAVYVVVATNVFANVQKKLRSHKFIRAAYLWLLVAGLLMIVEPLHLRYTDQLFSHAYTGAIRHALTVGFISQMIVGVGSHVIATMKDLGDSKLNPLWATFVLLNIGNLGRVACEIGTDYDKFFFLPMGLTGFLELAGLALWAIPIAKIILPRRRLVHHGA